MFKYDFILKNGKIVDPENNINYCGNLAISDQAIAEVAEELDLSEARQVVDVSNHLVLPGIIDTHTHLAYPEAKGAGYKMLIKAGVTTAIDFAGPMEIIAKEINAYGCGLNIAVLQAIYPEENIQSANIPYNKLNLIIENAMNTGAIGIKILGGHYPLNPETTANVIKITNNNLGYVGFHVGTTATGSNIHGLKEAIELAQGKPLHIAHINAYCRGLIDHPLLELKQAMEMLKASPNIVSESHLAPFNVCSNQFGKDGSPKSHVTRSCLQSAGYEISPKGLEKALYENYAAIHVRVGGEMNVFFGQEAVKIWHNNEGNGMLSFPVNSRMSAFICAIERDQKGKFVVDALSSDGGVFPRNFILKYGFALLNFGALTIEDFVKKSSLQPAKILGLSNKGHFSPGADADIIVVDPKTFEVKMVIIGGKLSMAANSVIDAPGKIITTPKGIQNLKNKKIKFQTINFKKSLYYNGKNNNTDQQYCI